MSTPQRWPDCDSKIKSFINSFVELLQHQLGNRLVGVYLHGSLAAGSYYPPKSDMDLIAVTTEKLDPAHAHKLAVEIAHLAETRPTTGNLEFSLITSFAAGSVPSPMPYELHYSTSWHNRIVNHEVDYSGERFDSDLFVHLFFAKARGCRLYGASVNEVIGSVKWEDYLTAISDDLEWVLLDEHLAESPYYGILNICRTFLLLGSREQTAYSKDEGGEWALQHFPPAFAPLIRKALSIYRSPAPVHETDRPTGGVSWNREELAAFRDYAREGLSASVIEGTGKPFLRR